MCHMENLIVDVALILLNIIVVTFVAVGMGYTVAMMFTIVVDETKMVFNSFMGKIPNDDFVR